MAQRGPWNPSEPSRTEYVTGKGTYRHIAESFGVATGTVESVLSTAGQTTLTRWGGLHAERRGRTAQKSSSGPNPLVAWSRSRRRVVFETLSPVR